MEFKNYEVAYLKDSVIDRMGRSSNKIEEIKKSKKNPDELSTLLKSHLAKLKEELRLLEILKIKLEQEIYNRSHNFI